MSQVKQDELLNTYNVVAEKQGTKLQLWLDSANQLYFRLILPADHHRSLPERKVDISREDAELLLRLR